VLTFVDGALHNAVSRSLEVRRIVPEARAARRPQLRCDGGERLVDLVGESRRVSSPTVDMLVTRGELFSRAKQRFFRRLFAPGDRPRNNDTPGRGARKGRGGDQDRQPGCRPSGGTPSRRDRRLPWRAIAPRRIESRLATREGSAPSILMAHETSSSRVHPTRSRKALFASTTLAVQVRDQYARRLVASTRRRIFASRSTSSPYSRLFSSAIAACEASTFRTAVRADVKTLGARLFSR